MTALTMRHEIVESTLLAVNGPNAISPEDWTSYCRCCGSLGYGGVLVIVDRSCSGPTSRQRAESAKTFEERGKFPNVAVVTASSAHRGIVTVMSWVQRANLRAYSPARLAEALRYAGVEPSAWGRILQRVHELALSLDAPWIVQNITLDPASEVHP
jgi:hypothetical protein